MPAGGGSMVGKGSRVLALWLVAVLLSLFVATTTARAQNSGPVAPAATVTDEAEAVDLLAAADQGIALSPLAPAPTTSPRQTFASFRALSQGAASSLLRAFEFAGEDGALFDSEEVLALKEAALDQFNRAASTLDLSGVPPANRDTVGMTSVLLLDEILDRIPIPDLDDIPDETAIAEGAAPDSGWTLPGTEIRIARVDGADGEPSYLFSAETVARLPAFYAAVQDMPQQSDDKVDFYQHFVTAPGLSMPVELYRHVLEFPAWMLVLYDEQAVWQWMALAALTVFTVLVILGVSRLGGGPAESAGTVGRSIRRLALPLFITALLGVYDWLLEDFVNLTGGVHATVELVVEGLQALALAVAAVCAFNMLAALIIASPRVNRESLDASLIRLVLRVLGILVAGYIVFLGATRLGAPVYGVVAGLGVGGLAIALAVRPTLENFIGGIILYADRPVKVGDFCKFGEMLGTVESIGLRSTKIRALDRTLVTVQNADFAQMSITNFTRRDSNLMHTTIGLRYETDAAELTGIIEAIAEMLRADDRVDADSVRVCFRGFGDYSLDVEIWAYVKSADWGQFLKIQEALFMKIMKIVTDSGTFFALPSRTTYLSSDAPPGMAKEANPAPALAPAQPSYGTT